MSLFLFSGVIFHLIANFREFSVILEPLKELGLVDTVDLAVDGDSCSPRNVYLL